MEHFRGKKSPGGSITELPPTAVYSGPAPNGINLFQTPAPQSSSSSILKSSDMGPNSKDSIMLEAPKRVQFQLTEVQTIMGENMQKLLERGDTLDSLQAHSEYVSNQAAQFKSTTVKVRRRLWWQNVKMNIAIVLILVILIAVIIAAAIIPKAIQNKRAGRKVPPTSPPTIDDNGTVNNIEDQGS